MAVWTDLVADATDGPLIDWDVSATEGRDWRLEWRFPIRDHADAAFDFSAVSDANCVVIVTDEKEAPVIADAAWTWAGAADGTFVLTCARASNAGKAGPTGANGRGRKFQWQVKLILPGALHIALAGGTFRILSGPSGPRAPECAWIRVCPSTVTARYFGPETTT